MIHLLLSVVRGDAPLELLHPLRYWGYQWWSGAGSDLGELTLVGTVLGSAFVGYHHVECHHEGCHRLGRFQHGHFKLCHVHHPKVPDDGKINAEHIASAGH